MAVPICLRCWIDRSNGMIAGPECGTFSPACGEEWALAVKSRPAEDSSKRAISECRSSVSETAKKSRTSAQPMAVHSRTGSRRDSRCSCCQRVRQIPSATAAISTQRKLRKASIASQAVIAREPRLSSIYYGPVAQAILLTSAVPHSLRRLPFHQPPCKINGVRGSRHLRDAPLRKILRPAAFAAKFFECLPQERAHISAEPI
jgi:hypothetical protein